MYLGLGRMERAVLFQGLIREDLEGDPGISLLEKRVKVRYQEGLNNNNISHKILPFFATMVPNAIREFREPEDDDLLATALEDVDYARVNFSHVLTEEQRDDNLYMMRRVKRLAPHIKFAVDLRGYETRTTPYQSCDRKLVVSEGETFTLQYSGDEHGCVTLPDEKIVRTAQPYLHDQIEQSAQGLPQGDVIFNDGEVVADIVAYDANTRSITLVATKGGQVQNQKSIATRFGVSMPDFSENQKDHDDISWVSRNIESAKFIGDDVVICHSFTQSASDIVAVKEHARKMFGQEIEVWAKIEDAEGLKNVNEIAKVADGIVAARGDGMSCHKDGTTESILSLELACQEAAVRHGKKSILATANFDSTAAYGKGKPNEFSDKAKRPPHTTIWSSDSCMTREGLLRTLEAMNEARRAAGADLYRQGITIPGENDDLGESIGLSTSPAHV